MTKNEALAFLTPLGQEHIMRYYDTLSPERQQHLLDQIADLNPESPQFKDPSALEQKRGKFDPLGALTLSSIAEDADKYREIGLNALQKGKLGAVLLAGGQGSRLEFDHPKGCYNIGLTHPLYIFECLIHNLLDVVHEVGVFIPLFVMTSIENSDETQAFLAEHHYFGYDPDYVTFFPQEVEPAVDESGKLLLAAPDELVRTPNGNGGWFGSMQRAGLIEKIKAQGIEWLNVFAVDNVLQRIADPVFLGATIASGCVSGGKVVAKADPDERIGVLCLEDDHPSIVEYYEMTEEMRTLYEPDGTLTYRFGVILNYLFRTDCLEKTLGNSFPLHIAHKKVPYLDDEGNYVKPSSPNAYKFETLVLDMVHMQDSCLPFEVKREWEFAPIKNATGVDSVDTARALLAATGTVL